MDRSQYSAVVGVLAMVPDPRQAKGQRYPWRALLGILAAALLSQQFSGAAIAHWTRLHPAEVLQSLSDHLQLSLPRLPSESTLRRALRRLDVGALEAQVARFAQQHDQAQPQAGEVPTRDGQVLRGQAIDGKEIRGAAAHGVAAYLVSLVRHGSGLVLGQQQLAEKSSEVTAMPELLAGRDLHGTVTTMDALNAHRDLAAQIVAQGGYYLMVIKGNEPDTHDAIRELFEMPAVLSRSGEQEQYTQQNKGHGRWEERTLRCSTQLREYLDWPGIEQVLCRHCRQRYRRSGKTHEEVTYALTNLPRAQVGARELEALWRGHWTIENRVHYVRDETWREDRCQMWAGNAPQALAALKNLLIMALRAQGCRNTAAALRQNAASVSAAFTFLATPLS